MDNIKIEATERTPEVNFDFRAGNFVMRGESYPEDASAFYGLLISELEDYLDTLSGANVRFDFEFIYFNSTTAKVLMGLFDKLDETAEKGNSVKVKWICDDDDDNMQELGEEFGEDLQHARFELIQR